MSSRIAFVFPTYFRMMNLLLLSTTSKADFELQILHTNDMQSRFEQIDAYGNMCPPPLSDDAERGPCFGGFARVKNAVERFTEQAERENVRSIFLNAGDTFQGSPYYSVFKSKIVAELLPYLGITAMSLGNHEFDDGIRNLVSFCDKVNIPILAANLYTHFEPELEKCRILKSTILNISGTEIGIIGYLTPHTKRLANTGKVIFTDEIQAIREEAISLKKYRGINIIIALGHSGLEKDIEIARKVPEVSLIVGGHSHAVFRSSEGGGEDKRPYLDPATTEYPVTVEQASGRKVPILHACCNTKYLGRLKVKFNDEGDVLETSGNTVLLDDSFAEDDNLKRRMEQYRESIESSISVPLGRTNNKLSRRISDSASSVFESNFGNMVTDAFVHYVTKNYADKIGWTDAAVALLQEGAIRTDISELKNDGIITYGDVLTSLPFDNYLVKVTISGSTLKKAFEHSVRKKVDTVHLCTNDAIGKYLYTSGIRVTFDLSKPVGNRVRSLYVRCAKCDGPRYFKVRPDHDADTNYTVIITDYLLNGGDGFSIFSDEAKELELIDDITVANVVAEYIKGKKAIYPGYIGRTRFDTSIGTSIKFSVVLILLLVLSTHL